MTTDGLSRRHALTGAVTVGLGVPLLAACGGSGSGTASEATTGAAGASGGGGGVLATTDEIEVGGGTIFSDRQVVVTQPTEGEFKGFSSICTHQGCPVTPNGGKLNCPCHGSVFNALTGQPEHGPAKAPLQSISVKVDNDKIVTA